MYTIARYTIQLGSTLPYDTLLECTWYLVSLVEAGPDMKWVDRGLIICRYRMLSSHGCCVCVDIRYTISTPSRGIRYDLAQLYQKIALLECTWYLVPLMEVEPETKWVDRGLIISRHRMLSSHGCCMSTAGTASCGYLTHTIWGRRRLGRGVRRGDPVCFPQ